MSTFYRFKKIGQYDLGASLVGTGRYLSRVRECTDADGVSYAIKTISKDKILRNGFEKHMKNDLSIWQAVQGHNNVLALREVIQTKDEVHVVCELAPVSLFDAQVATGTFDEATARRYLRQVVHGVMHCHRKPIELKLTKHNLNE